MKPKYLKWLFFLILIIFPLGQLLRLDLTGYMPCLKLQEIDFTVFIFVLIGLVRILLKKEKLYIPTFSLGLLLFCVAAVLSLVFKIHQLKFNEFVPSFFYLFCSARKFLQKKIQKQ